jgi:predicted phage terminase large subunit-like protein
MKHASFDIGELLDSFSAEQLLVEIEKADCEENFVEFIKAAWHVVEPGQPYSHNWHIDLIADHLTAITDELMIDDEQYYNRLLINVPPGAMKSLLTNVFWPAWEWGPRNMPHLRYVCASHSLDLAIRDSTKMRRLIQSEWYQKRWGDRVKLTGDQNAKTKFENAKTGFRQAVAFEGMTGARGDRVIIDDPHSVDSANSDQMRQSTVNTFETAVPTRLNNPDKSAIVVIMQRLHEEDVSGIILSKQLGYDHIMLPMEYDPSRAFPTLLGAEDPREALGELLFPERFPKHVVERDKRTMGTFAVSGQFQQTPTPADGGIIKRDWWQLWDNDNFPSFDYIIASLDTAYTLKTENDFTAMTVWGVFSEDPVAEASRSLDRTGKGFMMERTYKQPHPKVMLIYAWQERLELAESVQKVAQTVQRFKVDTILIENKAAGYPVAQELRRLYSHKGFQVILDDPKSIDKTARLYSIQHFFSEGLIYAPDKSWADQVITQAVSFPKAKHDDLVDTISMALRYLRRTGMIQRPEEAQDDNERSRQHQGAPPPPLYAV